MLKFLTDEDLSGAIYRGLRRHGPQIDLARAQDVGLGGAPDPQVLDWAAQAGRVLLTHDTSTMKDHANQRIATGPGIAGVIEVPQAMGIGPAVEQIILVSECCEPVELVDRVVRLSDL